MARNGLFESLSDDVSALILCNLSLSDISSVSQASKGLYKACRSNALWKKLLALRWNVQSTDESVKYYFTAYQQAHFHPHDLWVTHFNCVFPFDGLAPGRCCLSVQNARERSRLPESLPACPNCRDWRRNVSSDPDVPRSAEDAFQCASTFHRRLNIEQYKPGPTNFLTDLLFFNLTEPTLSEGNWELEQLLEEANAHEVEGVPSPLNQTTNQSWHIIAFTNPDFSRPIVYQIGIQRPECFTAYPSEGYIEAGQTIFITLGIRPLGSALSYAFEALNVQRDALDASWADLYTEQAHLPLAPFLVRYQFAAKPPIRTEDEHSPRRQPPYVDTTSRSPKDLLLQYHWKQAPAHQIRSIHLSAHVHAHYSFWEFLYSTCCPWEPRRDGGPIFVAPQLQEAYPDVYNRLENIKREDSCHIVLSHNEGPCTGCGRNWGTREEELLHAYFAAMDESTWHHQQRQTLIASARLCLQVLDSGLWADATRLSPLLVAIHKVLQGLKAAPWTTSVEKKLLVELEAIADDFCCQIPVGGECWVPWRLAGIYKYAVCSDSVFGGQILEDESIGAEWKDEPDYLDALRHLAHSPGRYCLGAQEDPNHLEETVKSSSKRYYRKQKGSVTDVFMDDPILAFQAGICMMKDPRSLLGHGIYDRIPYPGTVVRRPRKVPPNLIVLDYKDIYHRLQTASMSMHNYVRNIPPLGVGRFALSTDNKSDDDLSQRRAPSIFPLCLDGLNSEWSELTERQVVVVPGHARPQEPAGNIRGPRILHLLWLLGAQLGLAVIESPDGSSVFVDRKILIASQWISISLMAAPLFWTLCARYAQWIPASPVDYSLEDLPFKLRNEMRFLSERECGFVALLLLLAWLFLGRWTERNTRRDLFRVMLEYTPRLSEKTGVVRRVVSTISEWSGHRYDEICPLFLQRRVFTPHWNRRTRDDLIKHFASWRCQNLLEYQSLDRAGRGRGLSIYGDSRDHSLNIGNESSAKKFVVGILVALGSFCSSSPHFWLNLVTVFSCSISLGMSVSLHSLEKGSSGVSMNNTGSILKAFSLVTIVILAFLIGQLVGSSGGTMFLAEFIVTSISLILGGAGTISASAFESWACFFNLSSTAFFGYLFGRVALMDGIRQKRGGYSSVLLSNAVIFLFCFWTFVFILTSWDAPINLVIVQPFLDKEIRSWSRSQIDAKLQ